MTSRGIFLLESEPKLHQTDKIKIMTLPLLGILLFSANVLRGNDLVFKDVVTSRTLTSEYLSYIVDQVELDTIVKYHAKGNFLNYQSEIDFYDRSFNEAGALSLSDIQQRFSAGDFQPINGKNSNSLGFIYKPIWYHASVVYRGDSANKKVFLDINPKFSDLVFWAIDNDGRVLATRRLHERDPAPNSDLTFLGANVAFPLILKKDEKVDIFLQVTTMQNNHKLSLSVYDPKSFRNNIYKKVIQHSVFFGSCLVFMVYHLFVLLFSRDIVYLYYIGFLLFISLSIVTVTGLDRHLGPEIAKYTDFYYILAAIFSGLFAREFLKLRRFKKIDRIANVFIIAFGLFFILNLFANVGVLVLPFFLIGCLYLIGISVWLAMKNIEARFFLAAFSAFLSGEIALLVTVLGLLPATWYSKNGQQLGVFLAALILALAMGYKLRSLATRLNSSNRKLAKSNDRLKALDKMKDEFLSNTSHELRTPLNGIIGFTGLLQQGAYDHDPLKMRSQIGKIESLAETLKNQVNTILDLSKSKFEGLKMSNSLVSLDDVLVEATLLAESQTLSQPRKSFQLKKSWPESENPVFISDYEKMATILRNLVGNALKFCAADRQNHVLLELRQSSGRLDVIVKDTGIGISAEDQKTIFDEFKQVDGKTNRSYQGTGIGLAMVQQLVNLMGAKISVNSQLGEGSTFTVSIPEQNEVHLTRPIRKNITPIHIETPDVPAEKNLKVNPNIPTGYKILVVDDNPINCEVLQDILETRGYQVRKALGGKECLDILRQEKIDMVLLDLMMPEVSGEDVIRETKNDEKLRDIPIIVITARAAQDDRLSVLGTGADEYLAKPIIGEEIILRVKNTASRLDLLHAKIEKSELKGQLTAAKLVQQALIPSGEHSSVAGFTIEQHFEPADEAGGDWYQYFHDKVNQRLYVFITDVTGHGVSASIVTGLTYGAIHGLIAEVETWKEQPGLEEMLNKMTFIIDKTISRISDQSQRSMTGVFVGFDLKKGDGLITSAGHTWPYLVKEDECKLIRVTGKMMGFGVAENNNPLPFRLEQGETLFLYTDGLIENTGPSGESIRPRKLQKLLEQGNDDPSMKAKILDHCQLIWQDHKPQDDCTFLVIKRTEPYASQASQPKHLTTKSVS